jgi:hypothetical protein
MPLWPAALAVLALGTTLAAPAIELPEPVWRAQVTRVACTSDDVAEIEVISAEAFPVRNALTELHVGDFVSSLSRYADDGDTHTLIFSLTREQLFAISPDDSAAVRYNPSNGQDIWLTGPIDSALAPGCEAGQTGRLRHARTHLV